VGVLRWGRERPEAPSAMRICTMAYVHITYMVGVLRWGRERDQRPHLLCVYMYHGLCTYYIRGGSAPALGTRERPEAPSGMRICTYVHTWWECCAGGERETSPSESALGSASGRTTCMYVYMQWYIRIHVPDIGECIHDTMHVERGRVCVLAYYIR